MKNNTIHFHSLFFGIIFILIFFSSCLSQKASYTSSRELHNGAKLVSPSWKYEKTAAYKYSPYIAGAIGAGAGYFTEWTYDGKTYTGATNAAIWGGLGFFATAYINKIINKPAKGSKYVCGQNDKWLNKYNRQNNYNYTFIEQKDNCSIVIVPSNMRGTYLSREKDFEVERVQAEVKRKDALIAKGKIEEKIQTNPLGYTKWSPQVLFDEGDVYPSFIISMASYTGQLEEGEDLSSSLGFVIESKVKNVTINYEIEPVETKYFEKISGQIFVDKKSTVFYPNIPWKFQALRECKQQTPLKVYFRLIDKGGKKLEKLETITIRSIQDCLLSAGGKDLRWLFTAYVNEEHPEIDRILREGIDNDWINMWTGYQNNDPKQVLNQVKAIWKVLHKRGFKYSSITGSSDFEGDVISQPVRLFSDAIETRQANCIDGVVVVVMASILKKIDLHPVIVLVPGHAFLGFYPDDSKKGKPYYLETTMLGNDIESNYDERLKEQALDLNFEKALNAGDRTFYSTPNKDMFEIDVSKWRKVVRPLGN